MMLSRPTISCLMVTAGRTSRAKKAIQSYINQTYSKRDLLILSQDREGSGYELSEHIGKLCRSDIRFFDVPNSLSLGEMRNLSVELSTGELVCQWDDDDHYNPRRLANQYDAIRADNRNVASAYSQFLKYFEKTKEAYWCDWWGERIFASRFLSGSVMFYKKVFGTFPVFYPMCGPQSSVEEDLNAINKLCSIGRVADVKSGQDYVYVYHGDNVYNEDHHRLAVEITSGKKILSSEELIERRLSIEETFRFSDLSGLKIRSKQEVAFLV
jgi:glycosyltransferase involved in cell wall biosynthesis